MKYEVVCSKSYLDVGLLIEQNDKLEPKRVLARASTYRIDGEYGVYAGMTWIKTGVFLSKDEWIEVTYNKPTDQILIELGIINKENDKESIYEESEKDEDMSPNFMERETAICGYVCDKYYLIEYSYSGFTNAVRGLLLNYYGGNIVLLAEEGIYYIKYKDIRFMKPIKTLQLEKLDEKYQKLIKFLQEDNT